MFSSSFSLVMIGIISASTQLERNDTSSNKHLRLVYSEYPVTLLIKKDSEQNIISVDGVSFEMLKWLTEFEDFTYSFMPINALAVENTSNGDLGYIYYVHTGKADMILTSLIMSPFRFQFLDFPHPWMQETAILVIPLPGDSPNLGSIWQPFQLPVWIFIWVSIILIVSLLYLMLSPQFASRIGGKVDRYYASDRFTKVGQYTFGLLLSQGGFLKSNRIANRLIAGTWCLVTFVLVQAYSSTLISFVTTPTSTPLVKSPEDLANQPNVNLVVQAHFATEVILLSSQDPLFQKLGDKIRSYPNSRCTKIEDCLDLVSSGNHVFIHGYGATMEALYEDYKKTKKCRFSFAKNILSSRSYSWGLKKKSPFVETFNRGILQMIEKGLVIKWIDHFQLKPFHCMNQLSVGNVRATRVRIELTLKNFLGAFLFLGFGYGLSLAVFIFEHFLKFRHMKLALESDQQSKKNEPE